MVRTTNIIVTLNLLFLLACVCAAFSQRPGAQRPDDADYNLVDSSSFIPDKQGGWTLMSTYLVNAGSDSVQFELIIKQMTPATRRSNQLVGILPDKKFFPSKDQEITFKLLHNNVWMIRVEANGRCYIRQVSGSPLKESPFILPFKVRYRLSPESRG